MSDTKQPKNAAAPDSNPSTPEPAEAPETLETQTVNDASERDGGKDRDQASEPPCADDTTSSETQAVTTARPFGWWLADIRWEFKLLAFLALALVVLLLFRLSSVLVPIVSSMAIAYLLDPVVDRFEAKGISRTVAIFIIMAVSIVVLVVLLLLFLPSVNNQIDRFMERLPGMRKTLLDALVPLVERIPGVDPEQWKQEAGQFINEHKQEFGKAAQMLSSYVGKLFQGTYGYVMGLINLFLIPIFTFYFLRDFDINRENFFDQLPHRHQHWVRTKYEQIDGVLSSFIHGQFMVCMFLGTMYSVGLLISGVPLGLPIGLFAGLLAFIPYFGLAVGLSLAVVMSFLDGQPLSTYVGIAITFTVAQSLEGMVVTPRIVGDKVGLSPVAVIVALLIGGELFGFIGILFAVPAAAVLNILFNDLLTMYKTTSFFKE